MMNQSKLNDLWLSVTRELGARYPSMASRLRYSYPVRLPGDVVIVCYRRIVLRDPYGGQGAVDPMDLWAEEWAEARPVGLSMYPGIVSAERLRLMVTAEPLDFMERVTVDILDDDADVDISALQDVADLNGAPPAFPRLVPVPWSGWAPLNLAGRWHE